MWKQRGGEGLDGRLSHRGHTWSSLRDEFSRCRVWSLVGGKKDDKLSDMPLLLEALKTKLLKRKKKTTHEMYHIYVSCVMQLNFTHLSPLGNTESTKITEQWWCWRVHWIYQQQQKKVDNLRGAMKTLSTTWVLIRIRQSHLTMSAVAVIFGTIIKETGRTAAGSHPLKRATGISASHSRPTCTYIVQRKTWSPTALRWPQCSIHYIYSAACAYLHHRIFWFCWASKPIDPNKAAAEVRVCKIGIA